ncbi:hypothetical protein AURDEDRAFT_123422 [Auricularia subglabra TFB-10046 SS5]|nr:hypothetical protein AURDEDRAFT_123422 [Auricularia subglabra TFB-10046 SS5]
MASDEPGNFRGRHPATDGRTPKQEPVEETIPQDLGHTMARPSSSHTLMPQQQPRVKTNGASCHIVCQSMSPQMFQGQVNLTLNMFNALLRMRFGTLAGISNAPSVCIPFPMMRRRLSPRGPAAVAQTPWQGTPFGDGPAPGTARELGGPVRTQRPSRIQGPFTGAAGNPGRVRPRNHEFNPLGTGVTNPSHPYQARDGHAGPLRPAYPGFAGTGSVGYQAPWPGPQPPTVFMPGPRMGFDQARQVPDRPFVPGHGPYPQTSANIPYGNAPKGQSRPAPVHAQGHRAPCAPQYANAASVAPQAPVAGPHAAPVSHGLPPRPSRLVLRHQGRPSSVVAQATPRPAVAAPSAPLVTPTAPADIPLAPAEAEAGPASGSGRYECTRCHARFAQYWHCCEHIMKEHIMPQVLAMPSMIRDTQEPGDDA